jgi:hypothetical protein
MWRGVFAILRQNVSQTNRQTNYYFLRTISPAPTPSSKPRTDFSSARYIVNFETSLHQTAVAKANRLQIITTSYVRLVPLRLLSFHPKPKKQRNSQSQSHFSSTTYLLLFLHPLCLAPSTKHFATSCKLLVHHDPINTNPYNPPPPRPSLRVCQDCLSFPLRQIHSCTKNDWLGCATVHRGVVVRMARCG